MIWFVSRYLHHPGLPEGEGGDATRDDISRGFEESTSRSRPVSSVCAPLTNTTSPVSIASAVDGWDVVVLVAACDCATLRHAGLRRGFGHAGGMPAHATNVRSSHTGEPHPRRVAGATRAPCRRDRHSRRAADDPSVGRSRPVNQFQCRPHRRGLAIQHRDNQRVVGLVISYGNGSGWPGCGNLLADQPCC